MGGLQWNGNCHFQARCFRASFYLLCTSLVLGLARFLLLRKRRTNGGVRVVCSKVIASRRCARTRVRRTGAEAQSAKVTMTRVSGVHDGTVARGSL